MNVNTNIVYDYPIKWDLFKVLRDFFQNFYDSSGKENWQTNFTYNFENGSLILIAKNVSFNYEWLCYIGASTKRDNSGEFAGFYGEGFKFASLCAIRDFGLSIKMSSSDWKLEVVDKFIEIDGKNVRSMAYEINSTNYMNSTKLELSGFTEDISEILTKVYNSFFFYMNVAMYSEQMQVKVLVML
jgi:hypothetical protein